MKRNPYWQRTELMALIGTWAVISGLVVWIVLRNPREYTATLEPAIVLLVAYLAAALAADLGTWSLARRRAAHLLQLASVVALALLLPIDFLQIFTIIWIAMAASMYPLRVCVAFVPLLMLGWWLVLTYHWADSFALPTVALYGTFHAFALLSSHSAHEAERARDRTQALYRELVATQHLLSEASRQSERTRIARDLHDLVGHHLTALSINLQIAERQAEGETRERIAQSRGLAKLLLADVREAVSSLREQGALDLRRALELLVDNVPQLAISLEVDADVSVEDVDVADAIIRCVQEGITNTLRHSDAERGWVRIWQDADGLHVEMRDDGHGADGGIAEGNGITGMRERLRQVGGTLEVDGSGPGLTLRADIPLAA